MTVKGVIGVLIAVIGSALFGYGCFKYWKEKNEAIDQFVDLMKAEEELCRKCAVWIHSVEKTDEEE